MSYDKWSFSIMQYMPWHDARNDGVSHFVKFAVVWYLIDTLLFLIIGVLLKNDEMIATSVILTMWFFLTLAVSMIMKRFGTNASKRIVFFLPLVLVLAAIEEGVVYSIGGGLSGKAESLLHDYVMALPVFLAIGCGVLLSRKIFSLGGHEVFVIAAICGLIIEVILPFNLAYSWLFGGAALGIYGLLYWSIDPSPSTSDKTMKISKLVGGVALTMILVIFSGVVGDNLWNLIG